MRKCNIKQCFARIYYHCKQRKKKIIIWFNHCNRLLALYFPLNYLQNTHWNRLLIIFLKLLQVSCFCHSNHPHRLASVPTITITAGVMVHAGERCIVSSTERRSGEAIKWGLASRMARVACTTASTTITSTTADGVIAIGSSVWGHLAALVVLTILL